MTQALIRLDWQSQSAAMTAAANQLKDEALEVAALIGKVNDASTQEAAVQAQQKLSEIKAQCEKARKAAKAPALDFGRRIDDAAEAFIDDVDAELTRISILIGDFQKLELAKARALEELRLAEERRILEERRKAELETLLAAEAERRRLAAANSENERIAATAKTEREKKLLAEQQIEIERQRALSEAKTHEELDKINEVASNAQAALADRPKYQPVRAVGQRIAEDWDVTVNDPWALARAHPGCVKIEPLVGQIKAMLKAGVMKIPGVTATAIVKAGVTRGRPMAAIDV